MAFDLDSFPELLCAECGCSTNMFSADLFPDTCKYHQRLIEDILGFCGPEEEPHYEPDYCCEAANEQNAEPDYCCKAAPKKEQKAKPKQEKPKKLPKEPKQPKEKPKKLPKEEKPKKLPKEKKLPKPPTQKLNVSPSGGNKLIFSIAPPVFLEL